MRAMDDSLDAWFKREILVHEAALVRFLNRWPNREEVHDLRAGGVHPRLRGRRQSPSDDISQDFLVSDRTTSLDRSAAPQPNRFDRRGCGFGRSERLGRRRLTGAESTCPAGAQFAGSSVRPLVAQVSRSDLDEARGSAFTERGGVSPRNNRVERRETRHQRHAIACRRGVWTGRAGVCRQ